MSLQLVGAVFMGASVQMCASFKAIVDLNTYTSSEIDYATQHFRADGTWTISVNSPDVSEAQWTSALTSIGPSAYSEDNPASTTECNKIAQWAGQANRIASMQYHETGGSPGTHLTYDEITAASAACGGCGIIILTRAYWPGSEWRTRVEDVLSHPLLYGVAMEFNPSDAGKRSEDEFVNNVLAAGKSPFFLLPFKGDSGLPSAEDRIRTAIDTFVGQGAHMSDPRVNVVLARYDTPHLPIAGATNSIEAALRQIQSMQVSLANATVAV